MPRLAAFRQVRVQHDQIVVDDDVGAGVASAGPQHRQYDPSMRRLLSIAAVLTLLLAHHAFAWNGEAHQVIAYIAEERLSDKAKAGVAELLEGANISDGEIASWAD